MKSDLEFGHCENKRVLDSVNKAIKEIGTMSDLAIKRLNTRSDIDKAKLIVNGDATILIIDDEKYIVKRNDEEFDLEKAVMALIAKREGYTRGFIKRLMNGAIYQDEDERKAQELFQKYDLTIDEARKYVKTFSESSLEDLIKLGIIEKFCGLGLYPKVED